MSDRAGIAPGSLGGKMIRVLIAGALALALSACAYNTPVAVSPNLNVYVASGTKLPGRWLVWVDGSAFVKDVHATGFNCSAHRYPMDVSQVFRQSVIKTLENMVESVQVVERPVPVDQLAANGAVGLISVRSDAFSPRFVAIEGFWEGTIDANAEMSATIVADVPAGRMLATTAEGNGNGQSGSGGACEGASIALAQATEKAMKELIGTLAERLGNSQQLRDALAPKPTAKKK